MRKQFVCVVIYSSANSFYQLKSQSAENWIFWYQEMNREVNTIGSKAQNLDITKLVVEMKSEIEKIREQIQNIE